MGKKHLPENDIIEEQELMPHETALKPIAKRAQDSRAAQLVNSKKNIFVIDDEESIRHYLYEQLNNEYNVICFENGKLAFDNIITYNPTLIICDIMMPEMDGWTFCRKVKRNFKTSHIPVILLTALGDDKSKAQGIDIGADMYLEKPFNTEILKKIIKNMILNREKVTDNIVQKADAYDIENIELKSQDQILMQKVMQIIKEKISCRDLNVEMLADTIGISRVHLHRKLKDITGLSARDYLKNIRMKQASLLLTDKSLSISEIAYAVGYSNPAHFSASFKAFYGVSPTEYSARSKDDSINTDIQ
jgi:YesN/AraC family two-component response regulator